jgi:hypothetical protein
MMLSGELMLTRALAVWLILLALAFANGAVREVWILPKAGELRGHALSSVTLCLAIMLLSWFAIPWIGPLSSRQAWTIGGLWVVLTLAFEFLAGHYVFGNPWSRLLADYNVFRGRIWVLVIVTTATAPLLTACAHGLLRARE